jgi:branched-chain amino acid transport system substrate-binding protein
VTAFTLRGSVGVAVAGALLLSACSSSGTNAGPSSSGADFSTKAPPNSTGDVGVSPDVLAAVKDQPLDGPAGSGLTRGITSTSIKVGCVVTNAFFPDAEGGYAARFDRANAEGGINGREIDFLGCNDDGQSADTNLAVTKRLVEQDEAFAVMQFSTFATPQVTDYLNSQQVPFFGWGILPGFCGTRWGFGFNGCVVSNGVTSLKYGWGATSNTYPLVAGIGYEDTELALLGTDHDASRSSNADMAKIVEANGGEVVYNESPIPLTGVTDYTPFVRPVLAANPNAVLINVGLADLGKVIAALRAGGYKGLITNPTGYQPGLLETQPALGAALEGSYSVSYTTPIQQSTPYNTQMLEDLEASETPPGQGSIFAYAQADMLVQMLTAAGEDLNTETFDEAVNGGDFVYESDGGPAALPYPAGHFTGADCTAAMQVVEGKYVVKGTYACFESVKTRG